MPAAGTVFIVHNLQSPKSSKPGSSQHNERTFEITSVPPAPTGTTSSSLHPANHPDTNHTKPSKLLLQTSWRRPVYDDGLEKNQTVGPPQKIHPAENLDPRGPSANPQLRWSPMIFLRSVIIETASMLKQTMELVLLQHLEFRWRAVNPSRQPSKRHPMLE
uniref:Uncharacterized protein n=1 Tax=Moniliophthora roreri TaxID=221103 RepID=A0A0W0G981_MONRR